MEWRSWILFCKVISGVGLALSVAAGAGMVASCHGIDTTRIAGPKTTLGNDLYGVFCDRLGASSFAEDLSGSSFNAICHPDEKGQYGSQVDTSALPPPQTEAQQTARKLSVAKLETLARRRGELIRALDAALPNSRISNPKEPGSQIGLHDALLPFAQAFTPLYESNPLDASAAPLIPAQTRALAKLLDALAQKGASAPVDVLSRVWGRRGYRPSPVGLGVVRPALAYPDLRKLETSTVGVLGPGGSGASEVDQLLAVLRQELVTFKPTVAPLANLVIDPATAQPNRPRALVELAASLLLTQNPAFAESPTDLQRYIARRDRRGFAVPQGNVPGMKGTVPPPFADSDGDGFADVDSFGRFVDSQGLALSIDPPFAVPGVTTGASFYSYIDTSRTALAALSRHLIPLLDPTPADQHETLMDALAGAYLLLGDREDATYDYSTLAPGGAKIAYRRFRAGDSPLPDLAHAAGQILADPDSDVLLLSFIDLLQNHEPTVARLVGAALQVRDLARKHDQLAAQGLEPKAEIAYQVPLWDELARLVGQIAQHPGLLQALLTALADDTLVTPQGGAQHLGETLAKLALYRDELSYNPYGSHYDLTGWGVNGPAINLTVGPSSFANPKTPVDQTQPKNAKNVSGLQRSLRLIHDANGGPACNKAGAKVAAKVAGLTVSWPLVGSYQECELFRMDNLAYFYLDSLLPPSHPKRSLLQLKSGTLNAIIGFMGVFVSPDSLFEQSSDIAGLTLHPEPAALNRLVCYGASSSLYPNMPDYDSINAGGTTATFVSSLIEPFSAGWCPPDAMGAPSCSTQSGTLRVRDANTIFLWERLGFYAYLRPMVQAFASVGCAPDLSSCDLANTSGEKLLVDLVDTLNRHWPGPEHGMECSKTGGPGTYCSEAGLNKLEPLLADAFQSDLIPALHEFAKVALQQRIAVARGPNAGVRWTGAQVLEKATRVLFDPIYAAAVNMVDRQGNRSTTWVDGTPQPQLTGFTLLADALHKLNGRFDNACSCAGKTGQDLAACQASFDACRADAVGRQGQWKRALGQVVDELATVDGSGASAAFHDQGTAPLLISLLQLTREQLNANCPARETGTSCAWATKDLGDTLARTVGEPLLAALVDVQEKVRQDESARRQLEAFLQYILKATTGGQALRATLASVADLLQLLSDDGNLAPLLHAASIAAAPASDPAGAGAASTGLAALRVLADDSYDPYHALDQVLPNLVRPMDSASLSPVEVIMDVIADVNRVDAASQGPLRPDDYQAIVSTVRDFMSDKTRGLEQIYTLIQSRPRQ